MVVNVLQAVGIEQGEDEGFCVAIGAPQRRRKKVFEIAAGEEAGQRIEMRAFDAGAIAFARQQADFYLVAEAFDRVRIVGVEGAGMVGVEIEQAKDAVAHEERRTDDRLVLPVTGVETGEHALDRRLLDQARFGRPAVGVLEEEAFFQLQAEIFRVVVGEAAPGRKSQVAIVVDDQNRAGADILEELEKVIEDGAVDEFDVFVEQDFAVDLDVHFSKQAQAACGFGCTSQIEVVVRKPSVNAEQTKGNDCRQRAEFAPVDGERQPDADEKSKLGDDDEHEAHTDPAKSWLGGTVKRLAMGHARSLYERSL